MRDNAQVSKCLVPDLPPVKSLNCKRTSQFLLEFKVEIYRTLPVGLLTSRLRDPWDLLMPYTWFPFLSVVKTALVFSVAVTCGPLSPS